MVSKNLMAASTKPLILAILARGEIYGYQIIQRVIEISGGTLEWSEGMLYPVLHRLDGAGPSRPRSLPGAARRGLCDGRPPGWFR